MANKLEWSSQTSRLCDTFLETLMKGIHFNDVLHVLQNIPGSLRLFMDANDRRIGGIWECSE